MNQYGIKSLKKKFWYAADDKIVWIGLEDIIDKETNI